MSHWQWRNDNRVRLLENGEQFFPRVLQAIAGAREEVIIETFILLDDRVGRELQAALMGAAWRGLRVRLTVDGYGSELLSQAFIHELRTAGVDLQMFAPARHLFGRRIHFLRRLHRKIVVIDQRLAFVGGLNYAADQLIRSGTDSKQDYAVEVEGPVVADIHTLVNGLPGGPRRPQRPARSPALPPAIDVPLVQTAADSARVLLASRDNQLHRDDIERLYRIAIRSAGHRVLIANAYFFPGYRLIRELRKAAQRGVRVRLIMQGKPDLPWVRLLTRTLYRHLAMGGVEIHEYLPRPLHAKVAVIDDDWATVGSSNLDPLSLAINLEANLFIRDAAFAAALQANLEQRIAQDCRRLDPQQLRHPRLAILLLGYLAYQFARRFPRPIRRLPAPPPLAEAVNRTERGSR